MNKLAIYGGEPVRKNKIYYGRQTIDELDKQAVLGILNENKFLTTGPQVIEL